MHIRQAEISAGVAIGQFLVIDSHEVQDRGMVIVDVARIGKDVDPIVIGLAMGNAASYASAGKKARERPGMVVAALVIRRAAPGRAAEFGADLPADRESRD